MSLFLLKIISRLEKSLSDDLSTKTREQELFNRLHAHILDGGGQGPEEDGAEPCASTLARLKQDLENKIAELTATRDRELQMLTRIQVKSKAKTFLLSFSVGSNFFVDIFCHCPS